MRGRTTRRSCRRSARDRVWTGSTVHGSAVDRFKTGAWASRPLPPRHLARRTLLYQQYARRGRVSGGSPEFCDWTSISRSNVEGKMTISVRNAGVMPTRPCDFGLALQDDSVFADFSADEAGHVYLVRISYDGYGCNNGLAGICKMSAEESRELLAAVEHDSLDAPRIHELLLAYFDNNKSFLWADALCEHGLVK